ncbi:Reverse transcriptase domain [Trinorchestia longiramus]|nr:Reverse transcriptase domain [Trinorchestia longiramus]
MEGYGTMLHDVEKEREEDLLDWVACASDIDESAMEDEQDGEWKTTRNSRKRKEKPVEESEIQEGGKKNMHPSADGAEVKRLGKWTVNCSQPVSQMQSWGVIKRIHPSVNVEDIKASADCGSSELLSVTRLPQYSGVNCNSPLRCLVCLGPHTKDECTAELGQEKCENCHQTHIASSKECPAIRNTAAILKLQCSGVGFEAAKHKVMKTQTELATKAPFMKKQNLTVPTVSSNIMGSQHSIQENQQENQNDLTIQEVMVDIHQSGGSYLWSDAEALPSTASSSPLYSSVVQGLVDLPSTSEHFQLSGVQERTHSMNITQPAKKPSPQMTTATECAEILSKSVASLGKKLEHQMKEMGREMGSRVIQRLSLELKNKMESVITEVSHTILSKVSSLLSKLILANMQKEQPHQRQLLLAGMIRNHFGTEYSEPIITSCRNQENKSPSKNMATPQCGVRGGLAILVRLYIPFHHLRLEPFDGNLELQGVTLNTASGLMDNINVYNPNQPFSLSELRHYLQQLNHTFLFLGAFNAHSPLWDERSQTNPAGRALEEMLDTFPVGIINNDSPTYIDRRVGTTSTLDLFFATHNLVRTSEVRTGPDLGSNHFPVCCTLGVVPVRHPMGAAQHWKLGAADWTKWTSHFNAHTDQTHVGPCNAIMGNDFLLGAINSAAEKSVPMSTGRTGISRATPWNNLQADSIRVGKTHVKWLKNYLTGRTTSVHLGAVQSEGVPITWGLPQGAVLSPLLFNIMLSDLPVADGVQLIIYADDITILSKGDSLTEVRACLQRYLDSLAAWFKKRKLIVNPAKCSQQIFTNKHSIPDVILQLNNSVV